MLLAEDMQGILSNFWTTITGGGPLVTIGIGMLLAVWLISRSQNKSFMTVLRDVWGGIGGPAVTEESTKLDKIITLLEKKS
tara:strand:- start:241 stop:483 length:243 start_codon:yes stop_codon:yes gene_type:complete